MATPPPDTSNAGSPKPAAVQSPPAQQQLASASDYEKEVKKRIELKSRLVDLLNVSTLHIIKNHIKSNADVSSRLSIAA